MFITSENDNSLFESYMGVKYLVTDKEAPRGYKLWKRYDDYTVYINENTLPLGYATDRVISKNDYNELDYPNDVLALIGNVVADKGEYKYDELVTKLSLNLTDGDNDNINLEDYKDGYKVSVKSNDGESLKIKLDDSSNQKIYLLRFKVEKTSKL